VEIDSNSGPLYCHCWLLTIATEKKSMDLSYIITECNCAGMEFIHIKFALIIFEKQLITSYVAE
jgi:hypothetical protein